MSTTFLREWFAKPVRPRIITFGNQKGGSGKTTSAMNVMIGLMSCGYSVGSIDLDGDQATFTHFIENRRRQSESSAVPLDMPTHRMIENSLEATVAEAEEDETARLAAALKSLGDLDYIVIDTPGNDTYLARLGHILADTLRRRWAPDHRPQQLRHTGPRPLGPAGPDHRQGFRLDRHPQPAGAPRQSQQRLDDEPAKPARAAPWVPDRPRIRRAGNFQGTVSQGPDLARPPGGRGSSETGAQPGRRP
jgi:hypothetical protein